MKGWNRNPCELSPIQPIIDKLPNYVLVDQSTKNSHTGCLPICKGCFNVGESCGTPCTCCERIEAWNREFDTFMYIADQFFIYKRKVSK